MIDLINKNDTVNLIQKWNDILEYDELKNHLPLAKIYEELTELILSRSEKNIGIIKFHYPIIRKCYHNKLINNKINIIDYLDGFDIFYEKYYCDFINKYKDGRQTININGDFVETYFKIFKEKIDLNTTIISFEL